MKFACYTLGCKVNQYETQAMEQLLMQSGHTLGSFDEICDGYIINTCTVTAVSDKKSRNAIRRVRKLNPNAVVGVCGCYAQSSPDEIRKANDMGVIAGVTTNPSLIAKEHKDYAKTLAEIATIVDGPISGEVKATTTDAETMIKEGEAIYALDPKHMVVKIPMTVEGLKAIKALSAKGIPTNCTLIFSANQALLAARAGATYVSPFLGRLDDISQPGIDLIQTISEIFSNYPDIHTEIIAASVRNPIHITDCALAGADIATVPYKVIEQMTKHPLTDQGIEKFKADYVAVFGE